MRRTQLHRALSKLGHCSRSRAVDLIREGKALLNGRPVVDPLTWVDLDLDRISVRSGIAPGAPLRPPERVVLALSKPAGYVTTRSDERGRPTVYDLLPPEYRSGWLFPVGRLDRDSEGLLLFSSDGRLGDRITDPIGHVAKTYRVLTDRTLSARDLDRFAAGTIIDGRPTLPASISREAGRWYRVTLTEGRNRQVRKMFRSLGYRVRRLIRTAIGGFAAEEMQPGEWRRLGEDDLARLFGNSPEPGADPAADQRRAPSGKIKGLTRSGRRGPARRSVSQGPNRPKVP